MIQQFETIQKFSNDSIEATSQSLGAIAKGAQAIAIEAAQYTRTSFEQGTAALEKLVVARRLDKAIEVQSEYLKSAYEGFVAQSSKTRELYVNLAQDAFKPYEGLLANANRAKPVSAKAAPVVAG